MTVPYGIVCAVSLILIGVCLSVDKKELCLLLLFVSVFVCNLGQFLLSIAPSLPFALNANRIAYLRQVFLLPASLDDDPEPLQHQGTASFTRQYLRETVA